MGFQDEFSDSTSSNEECPWIDHELILCSSDGEEIAAEGTKYQITFADGSIEEGELDGAGMASHKQIARGAVAIEYEPGIWEEIEKTRAEIQCLLDEIIADEEKEKAELEAEIAKKTILGSNWLARKWEYKKAELRGFYTGAKDTVTFAWTVIKEVSKRSGPYYFFSGQAKKDAATIAKAWNKILNFEIEPEEVITYMLLSVDPKTWQMLMDFSTDYVNAQHRVEQEEFGGQVAFEIIVTLVSGGAALAAKARYLGKLKKIAKLLKELAEKIKKSLKSVRKTDRTHKKSTTRLLDADQLKLLKEIDADRVQAKNNNWKSLENPKYDWWPNNKKDYDMYPGTVVRNHPVKKGDKLTRYVRRRDPDLGIEKITDTGNYFSPHPPDIPFEDRALPGKESDYYKVTYEVTDNSGFLVTKSEATPWFDQPGHGIQYKAENSAADMIGNKIKFLHSEG